jgi:hypothetical protein
MASLGIPFCIAIYKEFFNPTTACLYHETLHHSDVTTLRCANQITKIGRPDLRVRRQVERGRDRQGGAGREGVGEETQGSSSTTSTTSCFCEDIHRSDATSRLQRTGALGPEECRFGRSESVGRSNL